jgi:hypothetical protein
LLAAAVELGSLPGRGPRQPAVLKRSDLGGWGNLLLEPHRREEEDMSGLRDALGRLLSDAGEALSTPSGVNVDLLPTYCPEDSDEAPDFSGRECRPPSR